MEQRRRDDRDADARRAAARRADRRRRLQNAPLALLDVVWRMHRPDIRFGGRSCDSTDGSPSDTPLFASPSVLQKTFELVRETKSGVQVLAHLRIKHSVDGIAALEWTL